MRGDSSACLRLELSEGRDYVAEMEWSRHRRHCIERFIKRLMWK